jgi:amidase
MVRIFTGKSGGNVQLNMPVRQVCSSFSRGALPCRSPSVSKRPVVVRSSEARAGIPCGVQARILLHWIATLGVITTAGFASAARGQSAAPRVVHYETTAEAVKYLFGTAAPVARLAPGDVLETNTLDAFGNALQKPGDTRNKVNRYNPLAGPFYVEGAEPGDTLSVKFLDLQVDSQQGVGVLASGALSAGGYTPMLNPPLPERSWFYPIDSARGVATFHALDSNYSVEIPLHPFLGCVGVAPAGGEARSSAVPAEFGGNMDAPEASVGYTLYLPVNVPGALLYVGDGHAAMGDGELAGAAIEVPMRVRIQVGLLKGRRIEWPRFENADSIMAVGAYRPLDDALRIAFSQLIDWIHADYGLSQLDAYELLSQVGKIHVTEMVDPNYLIVAGVEKKYLPARVN